MAHSGKKITAPVNILADLQQIFGTSSGSLGYIIKTYGQLGAQGNPSGINPWSLFKPFKHPAQSFNKDQTARLNALRACNCGLTVGQSYATADAALNAAIDGGEGHIFWGYDYPTNGNPFRQYDFMDYDGDESYPFNFAIVPEVCPGDRTPQVDARSIQSVAGISQEDLCGNPNLSGYYLGIACRRHDRRTQDVAKACTIDRFPVDVPAGVLTKGYTYDVCVFFSSVRLSWDSPSISGTYYLAPIPYSTFIWNAASGFWVQAELSLGLLSNIEVHCPDTHYGSHTLAIVTTNPSYTAALNNGNAVTFSASSPTYTQRSLGHSGWSQDTKFYLRIDGSSSSDTQFWPQWSPLSL